MRAPIQARTEGGSTSGMMLGVMLNTPGKNIACAIYALIWAFAGVSPAAFGHDGGHNPLGAHHVEWGGPLFDRVMAAGYVETFGTEAYPRTGPPRIQTNHGSRCVTASHLLFDIADRQYYDIRGGSTLTFSFFAAKAMRVQLAYDAAGQTEQWRWIELADDSQPQQITVHLPDARFINRGLAQADFALIAEGAITETDAPDASHEFVLCDIQLSAASAPEDVQEVATTFMFTAEGEPTPVRLGLYHADNGRQALPGDNALHLYHYDRFKRQHYIRSLWDSRDPWPHPNRHFIYAPSEYHVDLAPGDYWLVVSRGPEYGIEKRRVTVTPTASTVALDLRRRAGLEGWYPGDGHVHMLRDSPAMNAAIAQIASAEGLTVFNLLQMGNPQQEYFQQYAFGEAGRFSHDGAYLVPGIENPRSAVLGHTISQNIQKSLYRRDHYFDHHAQFSGYQHQGAVTGYAHVGQGWYNEQRGLALDVPHGIIDFLEVMQNGQIKTDLWYRFLNLGFKLAPMAGSDYPYLDTPGSVRLYAQVDGPFSTEKWFASAKRGRSFVTNGPMIDFKVNGLPAGEEIHIDGRSRLKVTAKITLAPSLDTLREARLIVNGTAVATFTANSQGDILIDTMLEIDRGAWIAVAVSGARYALAHTGAVYVNDQQLGHGLKDKSDIARGMISYLQQLNGDIRAGDELEYFDVAGMINTLWQEQREDILSKVDATIAIYRQMMNP